MIIIIITIIIVVITTSFVPYGKTSNLTFIILFEKDKEMRKRKVLNSPLCCYYAYPFLFILPLFYHCYHYYIVLLWPLLCKLYKYKSNTYAMRQENTRTANIQTFWRGKTRRHFKMFFLNKCNQNSTRKIKIEILKFLMNVFVFVVAAFLVNGFCSLFFA